MAYTNDPINSVTDRLRLKVGDTDLYDEGLTDEVYMYLFESQQENENRAALEALKMLVFKYARYVTEKAGGLFSKENERYIQYKELLERATKDPTYGFLEAGTPFAGGLNIHNGIKLNENRHRFRRGFHKDYLKF